MVKILGITAALLVSTAVAVDITPIDRDLTRRYTTVIEGRETLVSCFSQADGVSFFCTEEDIVHHNKLTLSKNETPKEKIISISICVILTLFGGLCSGLTVGLASIDRLALEIEAKGNE